MKELFAQGLNITGGNVRIDGPATKFNTLGDIINAITGFLVPIASVILFLILIWGGYDYLMSGGEAEKINAGKAKITAGLIGFVLLVFSYVIAKFFGDIFGLGGGIL